MAHELEQFAARLSARARRAAWFSECLRWSAPALFAIGAVCFVARFFGDVSRFDVADMREQVAEREARLGDDSVEPLEEVSCRAVAVATGDGLKQLYEDLGAIVVDGGPTLNPSTYELLAAIHSAASHEVVVLPNSNNVIMA